MIVYVSSTTILIPKDEKIWRGENTYGAHAHRMADTQEPTASCTHNNTQYTSKKNIKHRHHGPPKPPASSGSNFTGECNCRTSRDWSQSLQHGDVLFIGDTNFSFIYLTIILCAVAQRAHWLKVSFYRYISCFFSAAASKRRALTPAIRQYLIWRCRRRTHLVSAWFRTGGGGAPLSRWFQEVGGRFGCC